MKLPFYLTITVQQCQRSVKGCVTKGALIHSQLHCCTLSTRGSPMSEPHSRAMAIA